MTGYQPRRLAPKELPQTQVDHPPVPVEQPKRKRSSLACGECQRRRIKCGSTNPYTECLPCRQNQRLCVYNEYSDKRRKVSVQATAQGLLYYRTTLENLLRVIQTGDEKLIKRLIDDIRAGVPLEVISRTAAECLELTAVPPPPMLD